MEDKRFFRRDETKDKVVCLFCGEEADVRYFSGSCETYLACDCEASKEWYASRKLVEKAEVVFNARLEYLKALTKEKEAKRELEAATMQVENTKKEFEKQQGIYLSKKKEKKNE
jgi:hypothetical protein